MADLSNALAIAAVAFENKYDKGGKPYLLHCIAVMSKVKYLGEIAMICAILHDLVEDCKEWSFEKLVEARFSQEVIVILQLLTHRNETSYMDYIKALSIHPIAKAVKMADLEHNSNITRLKGLRKKDLDRIEKYFIAYEYLKD